MKQIMHHRFKVGYWLFALFVLVTPLFSSAQKTATRTQRKVEKRAQRMAEVQALIHQRTFEFTARNAMPQSGQTINLTTHTNYVRFFPDRIESWMPFFGRAYHVPYGGAGGIKFEGEPENYTIQELKRNKGYRLSAEVSTVDDHYQIHLDIAPSGFATLAITSNQRSYISYFGSIDPIPEAE